MFIAVADVQMNSITFEVCMEVFIAVAYVQINSSMVEVCASVDHNKIWTYIDCAKCVSLLNVF